MNQDKPSQMSRTELLLAAVAYVAKPKSEPPREFSDEEAETLPSDPTDNDAGVRDEGIFSDITNFG